MGGGEGGGLTVITMHSILQLEPPNFSMRRNISADHVRCSYTSNIY